MEASQAAPDRDPGQHRQRRAVQCLGQRPHIRQALGDDVAAVAEALLAVARRDRRRHRQPGAVQVVGELPFGERRGCAPRPATSTGRATGAASGRRAGNGAAPRSGSARAGTRPCHGRALRPRSGRDARAAPDRRPRSDKLPAREASYSMAPPAITLRRTSDPSGHFPVTRAPCRVSSRRRRTSAY